MQVIELNGAESITAIRDLLERATDTAVACGETMEVLLYVPRGCEALENNRVNLTVLRRWADNLSLRLALVFERRETRGLAREVGLLVVHSVEQARQHNLRYLDRRRRRREGLPPRPIASILPSRPVRPSGVQSGKSRRRVLASLVVAGALLLTVIVGLLFLLPSATVSLTAETQPVEASMEIVAVAGLEQIRYGTGEIPARTVSVEREGTDKIATTARVDVPDGHAQGMVVFANKTTIAVTITKGTVVRTSTGDNVRFFTVADAWLTGELYGSVRVGILAAEPGPRGNVPALSISVIEGELAAMTDVLNDARTAGGSVRRMGVVDGEDAVRLRAKLIERLQEEAYSELTAGLAQTDFVAPDSLVISVLDEEFDHKVGDMSDELGLTMKVKVTGLAVDTAGGQELVLRLLEQRMKPGYGLVAEGPVFARGEQLEASPEQARFTMSVTGAIAPVIDAPAVSQAIAGMTIQAAQQYLASQFRLKSAPSIEVASSPLQRLPWWSRRIRIVVREK